MEKEGFLSGEKGSGGMVKKEGSYVFLPCVVFMTHEKKKKLKR